MRALALVLVAALAGCAHAPPGPGPTPCQRRARNALALVLVGGASGGWGGALATVSGAVDDATTRWALAGVAVGLTAASVVTGYLGTYKAAHAGDGCP